MSKDEEDKTTDFNKLQLNMSYIKVALLSSGFIVFGAVFYHIVEKWSWLNSFYFTTVTLATVGYGDFVPKTDAGKIFTIFYIFFGITIFIVLAKIVLSSIVVRSEHRREKKATKT